MEARSPKSTSFVSLLSICLFFTFVRSAPSFIGVHPLDERYYSSEVIKCRDGSRSFTIDRLNDNFCDCVDGTDEPDSIPRLIQKPKFNFLNGTSKGMIFFGLFLGGNSARRSRRTVFLRTSACARGKFYCRNMGSTPRFIFSSRVNDHICDCCDGSDEYEGNIFCPNTCVMGGNMYKSNNDISTTRDVVIRKVKEEITKEDLFQKLTGLKLVIILQVALTSFAILIWANRCRVKSKRRRHR